MNYAIDPHGNNSRLRRYLEAREADQTIDPEGVTVLAELRAAEHGAGIDRSLKRQNDFYRKVHFPE